MNLIAVNVIPANHSLRWRERHFRQSCWLWSMRGVEQWQDLRGRIDWNMNHQLPSYINRCSLVLCWRRQNKRLYSMNIGMSWTRRKKSQRWRQKTKRTLLMFFQEIEWQRFSLKHLSWGFNWLVRYVNRRKRSSATRREIRNYLTKRKNRVNPSEDKMQC